MGKGQPAVLLRRLLAERGMSQAELARQIGTSKQQISKFLERDRISPKWAKLMEPILGVPWPALVEGQLQNDGSPDIEHRVVVGESDPKPGDRIYDPDELALLSMWRKLSRTKRAALFGYLGADDLPSLRKAQ